MRVTIDNLDGLGPIDYSDQLMAEGPLTVDRRLNEPSTCRWTMRDDSLRNRPARLGRVVVMKNDGRVLFTGYLPQEPKAVWAGAGVGGSVYRLELDATSDDWLLDRQGLRVGGESFAEAGDALLRNLTDRVGGGIFTTATNGVVAQIGSVKTTAARSWSENARAIADAAGASYRVVAGQVEMSPLGSVVHTLAIADDSLSESGLRVAGRRALANDVTVSGEMEAGTYVTEIFIGDGTTTDFALSTTPFTAGSLASRTIVSDTFSTGAIDKQRWGGGDAGTHLSVGSGGLVLGGGTGLDGQTTLVAASSVELGGALLLEATGVSLGQGSDGVLLGLYTGAVNRASCVAGFDVRQSNGATTVGCLVSGTTAGTTLTLASGHVYSLRMYLYAAETQRVRQSYLVMAGGVLQQFGGGLVDAPLNLVFAVEDIGLSSAMPMAVLFDGMVASSPAKVSFALVNSLQLTGSIGAVVAQREQPVWVRGTTSMGSSMTHLRGAAGTGADFSLVAAGTLRFFPGRVPAAGEQVTVQYRRGRRAAARVQVPASVVAEAKGGLPGEAVWQGSILEPAARSSEDCAAAASALLRVAIDRAEAIAGTYEAVNLPDVWPGDGMRFVPDRGTILATVRRVQLSDGICAPELVRWKIEVANDWVDCASIHVSKTLAPNVGDVPVGRGVSTVPGLARLQVVSVTKTALQIDTGAVPPSGGGFEVRRSEGGFGPGQSGDLVLRSGVRGITIPRVGQVERFYVRMYDGSTPPVYSRLSSAVVTNVPVG